MNDEGHVLRSALLTDLEGIKALADRNKQELGFVSRGNLRRSIEEDRLLVTVGETGILGFTEYYRRRDGQLTIYAIVVDEQQRKQGLGRAMIEYFIAELNRGRAARIALKCPAELPANQFYATLGFSLIGSESPANRRALNHWTYT